MTLKIAGNYALEWQWHCCVLTSNTIETAAGYIVEKYEEIDYQSMLVFVQAVHSGKTIDVGIYSSETGGDADGFLDGVSIATAGWIRPSWTVALVASVGYYFSAATLGDLFLQGSEGTAALAALPVYQNFIGDGTAKTITYTCSSNTTTFVGALYFRSRKLPDLTSFLANYNT